MKMRMIEGDWICEDDISSATYNALEKAGWSDYDMGLEEVDDGLFKSEIGDWEGALPWSEIKDLPTEFAAVSYWDGNNWRYDVFDWLDFSDMGEAEIIRAYERDPSPDYYHRYDIIFENGERVPVIKSNMSGSLSPYYESDE